MSIKTLSFGCRLNALETEKIACMLKNTINTAIIVNTCAVTGEAERQSAQMIRKLARENTNVAIFVTGCAATRNKNLFIKIPHVIVIPNKDKLSITEYINAMNSADFDIKEPVIDSFHNEHQQLSKKFIQIQNGCNHKCAYCVTRLLRGPSFSFSYDEILQNAKQAVKDGFYEIVLTGVDVASYVQHIDNTTFLLSDLCKQLLQDVPQIQHLRLSSIDPASPEIYKIINIMKQDSRFMPHLHLSMQSGSDTILNAMHRRHTVDMLRNIVKTANTDFQITFSADIICGFPGETEELFQETFDLIKELGFIRVHAFPFSPRPETEAEHLPNQIAKNIAKKRVNLISNISKTNLEQFMVRQINKTVSVLVEENNIGRTPDDINIKIINKQLKNRTVCNVKIIGVDKDMFIGEVC